jgi:hypothetical protein
MNDGSYHKNLLDAYFENFAFTETERFTLTELRGFRHVVRSAYGYDLEAQSLKDQSHRRLACHLLQNSGSYWVTDRQ